MTEGAIADASESVDDSGASGDSGASESTGVAEERDVGSTARLVRWWWLALGSSLVIAWSTVRGIVRGYQTVGDNGLLELRARDVFTEHHPLLGSGSSASVSAGIDVNHPGPLLFDLMAIPLRLFGTTAGIPLAIGLFHILTVWLGGLVIARTIGNRPAVVAQVVTAGIVWTLGSEMLYDPWQPNVLVLPFWCFVCCVWAVGVGGVGWLPLAVAYGSFAMQTHLSYAFVVPVLLVFVVARVAWSNRGSQRGSESSSRDLLRRPLLWSAATLAVLWAQPLWEQAFGPGRGNLTRLAIAGTGGEGPPTDSVTTGFSLGARILASVLALPPWWGRPGYDDAIPPSRFGEDADGDLIVLVEGLPSLSASLAGLFVLVALVGGCWWIERRRGDTAMTVGYEVLFAMLVLAAVTVVVTPIDILGLSPHKLRWLWVVGAFATLVLVLTAVRSFAASVRPAAVVVLAAIGVVALVATVPTYANQSGPVAFREVDDAVERLRAEVAEYVNSAGAPERFVFDADGIGFGEPYTSPIIAELAEQGVDFVVTDPSFTRQVGDGRLDDGGDSRVVMFVRVGEESQFQSGADRIAFHDGEMTDFSLEAITDRAVGVFVMPRAEVDR